jgi:hypothetical protein
VIARDFARSTGSALRTAYPPDAQADQCLDHLIDRLSKVRGATEVRMDDLADRLEDVKAKAAGDSNG